MQLYSFVFTGKERDEETGYGYFGARYMDHELMTMWLSVDPMADKYPSISPYNYCMWNPIKLVDPDGSECEDVCPWYRNTNTGEMHWTPNYLGKAYLYRGQIWNYVGNTFEQDGSYYSLFGDVVKQNSINGQLTMKIDGAFENYASYLKEYKRWNQKCNETGRNGIIDAYSKIRNPEPREKSTDFMMENNIIRLDNTWASNNENGPSICGKYARGRADIFFENRGANMLGKFTGFSGTQKIQGAAGHSSPAGHYLTFGNASGVIIGLNFPSQRELSGFNKLFDKVFGL